jgi:5'-3' exonuclease
MGIERFYGTIIGSNKISSENAIVKGITEAIDVDYLYVDFNSIVYYIAEIIESELNTLLYHLITHKVNDDDMITIEKYNINYNRDEADELSTNEIIASISDMDVMNVTVDMVDDFIEMLCTKLVNGSLLKQLYISIDGMPNMGKIWEQKKRRYSGSLLSRLQKIIYEDFKDKLSKERIKFEENRFIFDRSLIGPNSPLMDKIVERFTSPKFIENITYVLEKLDSIIVNHHNIPGEGEKKIMEHIIASKNKGKYCIYSPDSDIVVLSIILNNIVNSDASRKGSTFDVIRRDQQHDKYDYINTDKVITNIMQTIYASVNKSHIQNKINDITSDISFIVTLFGNDFIPRIETINISVHIDFLLNKYIEVLKKLNSNYSIYSRFLLDKKDGKYQINWVFLMQYINEIASNEHLLYGDFYIEKNYNYRWFKKYINKDTMTETVYDYVDVINNYVFPGIHKYQMSETDTDKSSAINEALYGILNHYGAKDAKKLIPLIEMTDSESIESKLIEEGFGEDDINAIEKGITFVKYFISAHKFTENKLRFADIESNNIIKVALEFIFSTFDFDFRNRFMKGKMRNDDINDTYHQNNILSSLPVEDIDVTDYDKEIYKLERRIEPYNIMMNEFSNEYNMGRVSIRYVRRKTIPKYEITQNSAKANYNTYVKKYLDGISDSEITKLSENYIMGLCWILDFYMNRNDKAENLEYVSTWFFPHYYAPTMYMLSNYFKKLYTTITKDSKGNDKKKAFSEFMTKHTDNIFRFTNAHIYTKRHKFMNKEEHYLFVNPVSSRDSSKVSEIYLPVRENRSIFPDLRDLAQKMYDKKDKFLGYMDCKTALYNTKCKMDSHILPTTSFNEYMEEILKHTKSKRTVPSTDDMEDIIAYV